MPEMTTTTDIIDALGGTHAVARLTSSSPTAVSNWKATGVFPSNTYLLLKQELVRCGITAPDNLWSMREKA